MTNAAKKIEDLNTIATMEDELKAKRKALKAAQEMKVWQEKTKDRNPQYVMGSLRQPTRDDEAELTHCHGMVCDIVCTTCGKTRVINKQDAFQVKYCLDCRKEARKTSAKGKRAAKRLEGKSPEDLQAELDALNEQLEAMS